MASSQPSPNVELEAAKFLQKLIHDSKDEPAKLATKLFVILQHMRSSGKEHSMPYQVISRAMETVISQHNLDIEALMSSQLPLTGGGQGGDSGASSQYAGSSQAGGVGIESKGPYIGNDPSKVDLFSSSRPPVGPGTGSHDYYQGSGANRSNQSFDHESPSSLDTKSANSQSQERGQKSKDSKKGASKRRRGDSSLASESHVDSSQQLDRRKGKLNSSPGGLSNKESENAGFGIVSSGGQPEAPTVHVPAVQQGGSLLPPHESPSSRVSWNQSRAGLPLEKSQVPRFSSNSFAGNVMTEMPAQQSTISSPGSNFFGSFGKIPGGMPATSSSHVMVDTSFMQFGASEPQKNGIGKSAASHSDKAMEIQSFPTNRVDDLHTSVNSSTLSEQDGGNSTVYAEANYSIQGVPQNSSADTVMARTSAPRDLGKSSVSQNHLPPGILFKEHQLKQLRAQCLVFLAFRNGLIPKKLHLEVALGSLLPKDGASPDGRKEMVDQKGKAQSFREVPAISDVPMAFGMFNNPKETDRVLSVAPSGGRLQDGTSLLNQDDQLKAIGTKIAQPPNFSAVADERKHFSAANSMERVKQGQETMESDLFGMTALQQPNLAGNVGILGSNNPTSFTGNGLIHGGRVDQASPSVTMKTQHELLPDRKDDGSGHFQSSGNIVFPGQEDDENSASGDSLPSPRYTMSEKWIMDVRRKKVFAQQKLILKQQKTKQRIAVRFEKLKEVVSLSEDLSAKTKNVIELKKLQLLELQHRLRSDFLGDFFKPIAADMDRLKSYKKHKHGRRARQLEKFEQKMKEERQKRIRERQKEFFAEIEVHKERVDDIFKIKKERWKGFNRYVKEFHKRKERIHREKIDRIQREKINLLKINDVEGYLRMVQDAKSDRVKQLLKETEKYLQKLGSKLRDAKVMTSRFESDMDETRTTALLEKNETSYENDDESDQAKHYLESNEKYYLMAHSIKESIAEQPTSLVGGKLREYQMNGLRWLVSLYNNHLNGILADEMGLGKTVQVISLICYLMETKNDRGPFLVVVPSSVLPGWESEIDFWAPGIHKIVYSGPPEERRRLFKEQIVHQKFNVLLTTYEYLMNKHDRPKLSKVHWHYVIIDEGHRIKNASCKLNADLKYYQSSHRLLLTGTPLQNNLEELWALLNFLLPNIFNSSEDFSQWFNKPFEGNGDNSAEEALLSEEENLLIINRLHQVLRPFVLRRLKHKVENQLPEKIERLIRCEASAYQKLLMKRVEDNLGSIGNPKARSVHNSVMELRNICNHPYLSQLHSDEVDNMVPRHFLPNIVRHCGKLEMLDRLLPKLKATDHRVLFFSTMTRLLDIMEEYLTWKQYRYLRLDGHTAGGDRGALIDQFNHSNSPYFIFLLSIRAGGVGVNLQAADTVIIFDTDWNPQVDLQAQARAHRIGQKRDVLVLRFETVKTVEEQVRASAEHKLGVANQSITAGFFDNNTSAEDRREYLEALLRECKKEEDAPVLDDDALNDLIARSESEIDIFESIDKRRQETETGIWKQMLKDQGLEDSDTVPSLPSRLVTDDDLKAFYDVIKLYDVPKKAEASNVGMKRKGQYTDTQHYGRGKRAREVRSYEEQWTEEEFEKLCQSDSPGSPSLHEEDREWNLTKDTVGSSDCNAPLSAPAHLVEPPAHLVEPPSHVMEPPAPPRTEEITPPPKRGRGRPRRVAIHKPATAVVVSAPPAAGKTDVELLKGTELSSLNSQPSSSPSSSNVGGNGGLMPQLGAAIPPGPQPVATSVHTFGSDVAAAQPSVPMVSRGRGRKVHGEIPPPRRRGRKPGPVPAVGSMAVPNPNSVNQSMNTVSTMPAIVLGEPVSGAHAVQHLANMPIAVLTEGNSAATCHSEASSATIAVSPSIESSASPSVVVDNKESNQMTQSGGPPRRRGRKPITVTPVVANISAALLLDKTQLQIQTRNPSESKYTIMGSNQENEDQKSRGISSEISADQGKKSNDPLEHQQVTMPTMHDVAVGSIGYSGNIQDSVADVANAVKTDMSAESSSLQAKVTVLAGQEETGAGTGPVSTKSVANPSTGSVSLDGVGKLVNEVPVVIASASQPISGFLPNSLASQSSPAEAIHGKRQGLRGSSGVEGPRRRGRRPGSASSIVEVSVGQDPKLDLPTPYKSRDASGSMTMSLRSRQETDPKLLADVVQESNLPAVVAQDLKRKEPGGNPTVGRLQTADVTGVARLMKEIFSDSRSTTHASALNKAPMEVPKSQSSGDKACPTSVPTLVAGVTVDSSKQSGSTIRIDVDDGPPGFGSCNKKDSMSKAPLVSSHIVKSANDGIMAADPSGFLSGDSKSPPVQDLLISKSSCNPSAKESLESSRVSLTPDAVIGAGVDNAGEFKTICPNSCDLGSARLPAANKKDPATESQPSKESFVAGVRTLKETSIASERSVDDPLVDVSAPATIVADIGTVRSDLCPAEEITAEYTGEDVVKSQPVLDNLVVEAVESQPSLEESESPAAGVGNLKESSIASEMSADDSPVDGTAPATNDTVMETVRYDLCPAEAITAEHTGEDIVKSQAVLDNLVVGAAETQPSLKESEESPAAGVGTPEETSTASEMSVDDPLVDVTAPATKDADVGTVSDSCPAEYTGEDGVKSQAVLDNLVVGVAETQPSLEEYEESPAADVGTLKETSVASERSGDDPLVDVSAPATKDADVGTVRSDSCPGEAMTPEYTGEDVVRSQAALDNLVVGAAETQPLLTDSEESPAAGIGTLEETCIASERSVDDPLVDVTAPATNNTDVGTVRSDSCPGEAITAKYTGEDVVKIQAALDNLVVGTAEASRDESDLPCAYNDHNSKSMPEPDIPVTSKCTAAELADFCSMEKQAFGGIATSSGCSSLKEDNAMIKLHQGLHKGNTGHNGSTEGADLSNSSSSLPQDSTATSAGLQIIDETKLSDRSMPELDDIRAECGQTSLALEDSTPHLCSALGNERVDSCQDGLEQNSAGPQVADRVITDVVGRTLDIQQDGLPLPSVVMEENKIGCLSNEGPAGGISALEQPSEAEMPEDGGVSQPGLPLNHSSEDSVLPSSALLLEQEDHELQLHQGLPLPAVVMEENKIGCFSHEGPAGGKQPSEAEMPEDGGLSQPGAPPNHSSEDSVLPSSSLLLEQDHHKLQLDRGLCDNSDLAEKIKGLEAKEVGGTDITQGNSSLDNASESLPLPLSCLVTVEDKGSVEKDSVCQSMVSEPDEAEARDGKDGSEIGLNDPLDNTMGLDEQMAQGLSEKGSICGSESLSTDSGSHGPMETNQVEDLVFSLVSGSVVFSKPTLQIEENRNESSLKRDPPGCSGAYENMEVSQPEVADQMMVDDNTCVYVSTRPVTRDASQTGDSISPKPETLLISSPLMIESAMVEGSSEGSQPKMSDQMIASNTCISAIENSAGVIQRASVLEEAVTVSQPETDETGIAEVPETLEGLQAKVVDPADICNACVSEWEKSVQPTSTSNQVIIESQTKGSGAEGGDQLAIATTSVSGPEKLADMVQPEHILEERMDGKYPTEVFEPREAEAGVQLSACASEPESRSVNLVPPASVLEEQMIENHVGSTETAKDERKNEMNVADPCASQSENTPGRLVHLTSASEEVTEVQQEASAAGETETGVGMQVADACVSEPENESAKMFLPASSEEQMNGSQTGGAGTDKTTPEDHQHGSSAEKDSCEDLASHTEEEEPKVSPEDDLGNGDTCTVPENCAVVPSLLGDESGNVDLPAPLSTVQKHNSEELHPNTSEETKQHDEPVSENSPDDFVSPSSAAAAAAATEEKINALFEDNLESDPNGFGNEPGDHTHPMLGGEENDVEPSEDSPVVRPSEVDK